MIWSGDLVYTNYFDRSINPVSRTKIQTLITLWGWRPYCLCITFSGDLLVCIESVKNQQSKDVCYSSSTAPQRIQWDDQCKPLYSSGRINNTKYIIENRNLYIGVAVCAVVVVRGKLPFRYTGPPSSRRESFHPECITTDN